MLGIGCQRTYVKRSTNDGVCRVERKREVLVLVCREVYLALVLQYVVVGVVTLESAERCVIVVKNREKCSVFKGFGDFTIFLRLNR